MPHIEEVVILKALLLPAARAQLVSPVAKPARWRRKKARVSSPAIGLRRHENEMVRRDSKKWRGDPGRPPAIIGRGIAECVRARAIVYAGGIS